MRAWIFTAAALSAACAAQPVLTPDLAQQMSLLQLCEGSIIFRPNNAETALAEVRRRGADCAPLYPAIQARLQAQSAAAQAPQVRQQPLIPPLVFQPPPVQRSTTCTTRRILNELQTVCN